MKLKKYFYNIGAIVMISIANIGCVTNDLPFNTVIRNTGSKLFRHTKIVINNTILTSGSVSPGKYAVRLKPSVQLSDNAIISWQREDGKIYQKEIVIKGKLPKLKDREEYYLIFDINDSNMVKFKVLVCSPDEDCIN